MPANRLNEIHLNSQGGPLQNSFAYDLDGNRLQKKDGSGSVLQSIIYDPKGRPQSITTSGIGTATTATYDPYDYRISKTDSTGTKNYMLQGEHIEAIWTGSTWLAMYFRGVVVDEVVNGYQMAPSGKWVNYTTHHDALQSVFGLSGHDGTVLQTIAYDPFGSTVVTSGSVTNNTFLYTGREPDPDTGLYYYRVRPYDPVTGTFITEDPMGFAAGMNFYAYAGNNPINASDPYGLTDYNGFNPATSPIQYLGANNTPSPPGTYTAAMHGNPYYFMDQYGHAVTPQQFWNQTLAPAVANRTDVNTVILCICFSGVSPGNGQPSPAQQLENIATANGYNLNFIGPNSFGWLTSTGGVSSADASDPTITWRNIPADINSLKIGAPNTWTEWSWSMAGPVSQEISSAGVEPQPESMIQSIINGTLNQILNPPKPEAGAVDVGSDAAGGGYLLYPNMPNTNMTQAVYSK